MNYFPSKDFKIVVLFVSVLIFFSACKSRSYDNNASSYPETKLGWKLGAQAFTFNRFTFFEAIDKIDS